MKKLFVAILAFVYITTSTGASVHLHYCMGQVADWGLVHNNSKTCGKCGMEKSIQNNNGCCKDELKFLKNISDQKTTEAGFNILQLIAPALPVSLIEIPSKETLALAEKNPVSHAPPRTVGVAVYIRNCVFLI